MSGPHDETGDGTGSPPNDPQDTPREIDFADLLAGDDAPLPKTFGARPSFFPDENPEQSRAFADALLPSMRPPGATKSHAFSHDSGLYATEGLRTRDDEDGTDQDDVSSVVLLHTGELASGLNSAIVAADGGNASGLAGLTAAIDGRERALADDGAIAAWRTVPLRRRRDTRLPLVGGGPEVDHARAHLQRHLAERAQGATRAQLLLGAAEGYARAGDFDTARMAEDAAFKAAPQEPAVLERAFHEALRTGDEATLGSLLAAQLTLPLTAAERAHAACTWAELAAARNATDEARDAVAAALHADPHSLLAELLCADTAWKNELRREAADALVRAAELAVDSRLRCALLLTAARACEHVGEPTEALSLYARAAAADPSSRAAALGAYRVCRAERQLDGAQQALGLLATLCASDTSLAGELSRQRARLLHDALDRPGEALALLIDADSVLSLRAKARAAEAVGDDVTRMHALRTWADTSGGSERALALIELALFYAAHGEAAAAEQTLHDAALAGAPRAWLGLLRESLARADGDAASLSHAALDESAESTLRAAAKLAPVPSETARELALLVAANATGGAALGADVLTIDAAAEAADLAELQAALSRSAQRLSPADRIGPQLAQLDLLGDTDPSAAHVLREELAALSHDTALGLRRLARDDDPARTAALWLAEASHCDGERAAFAATMAGRYLEDAGSDPIDAYVDALDAVRGYPPACYALELAVRQQGDLLALERVHRELSSTSPSRLERAARRVRLALLAAEADPQGATAWLDQAAEERGSDVLLSELGLRIAEESPAPLRAERLLKAAALETTPRFLRATQLRAASACEDAGRWHDALELYDRVLAQTPDADRDVFAALGRTQAMRQVGQYAELIAEAERALFDAATPAARTAVLERLAQLELARGEPGRARSALETLLEGRETDVVTLRTLERLALDDGDLSRTLFFAAKLAEHSSDEHDRAAELRLAVRADAMLGGGGDDALLLRLEGSITRDLWYALALEALALRTGDRARFYEAARAIADNLEGANQKAAYAVRAAEAFEAAAPGRAAADLEPLLLGAPDHPLAIEELARLYKGANEPRKAANMFLRAAAAAPSDRRRTQLMHAAGVIFHDELADREAALSALLGVVELDVLYADAFERAQRLLAARGDRRGTLALLERRIAKTELAQTAALQLTRAQLHAELGERESAKAALRAALAADAAYAPALRMLAELCTEDAQHREAADALVQLARVSQDPATLAFAFFALGELYDGPLPDPRRAEIAYTRVVALSPDDPRAVERLIVLWTRSGAHERAARALSHLLTSTQDPARRERYLVDLSHAQAALGDDRLAEKTLEDARQLAPGSVLLLRALAALYERQQDRTALSMHLVRSCHGLRSAIEVDPADPALWQGLVDMLEARARHDGAALVAQAARCLGHSLVTAQASVPIRGLGAAALSDATLRKIMPRGPLDAARALFQALPPALTAFLPAHVAHDSTALVVQSRAVAAVTELFSIPKLELFGCDDPACTPIANDPLTLLVSRDLAARASEGQLFFLLTRATAIATHGLSVLVRADPEQLLLFMHALIQIENPRHSVAAIDMDALNALTRDLQRVHTPELAAALEPRLVELRGDGEWNPRRSVALALDFGSRVALCVTGDCVAAFEALLLLRDRDPLALTGEARAALAKSDPTLRALLSFAVSEAYLELRGKGTS